MMSSSLCSIVSEVIPSCSNEYKKACCCTTGLFLQEERHHHAKQNEQQVSKAFTATALIDFVI